MPLPSNPADEPTLKEALEGFAALPAVLDTLRALQGQIRAMQGEIERLRRVSGNSEKEPVITWQEAKGKRFVTLKQAAYLLGVSDWTVRRHLKRGLLYSSSATRHKLISVESLEEFSAKTIV
jgi:TolA-binding protein